MAIALRGGGPRRGGASHGGPHRGGPPSRPETRPPLASVLDDDAPAPSLPIQLNALQALCRQVFGFRLAMIGLGAPFALESAQGRLGNWLVGAAVVISVMGSYAVLRDWERIGPLLLRHQWLFGVDLALGTVLLLTATADSPLGYATVCTPLLAGLLYGWRGAAIFTALQVLVLFGAYSAWQQRMDNPSSTLIISGFCAAAGIIGVTLRNLMFRFGAATQALAEATARLTVSDAVEGERARLAREMHDSVAKTLHGLAMAADSLAASADRMDPLTVKYQAGLVARSARRAAAESRELLADLRRRADHDTAGVDISAELAAHVADFGARAGIHASYEPLGTGSLPPVPHTVARHLLTIATEAMENSHRHAGATRVRVELGLVDGLLRVSVLDNGRGLPPGTSLDELRRTGHFGLVGMVERAAGIGARIRIGRGRTAGGTEVRVELPIAALSPVSRPLLN
ncbi:sensor histidine kinase [Streptomyces sp. GC420]|uniref:sensor histidine kinase n=1 Tax=Streptomyces sp. GC420 TaxID=2697568 RepID=UPI001414DC67|nr:histidine kinase [Streptomyces sp. GC420]NBM20518.1 two-component sensor histidine kinase [Streptomyces sp. GC420]